MDPLSIGELIVAAIAATGACFAGQRFAEWGEKKYGWDLNPWVMRQLDRVRARFRARRRK